MYWANIKISSYWWYPLPRSEFEKNTPTIYLYYLPSMIKYIYTLFHEIIYFFKHSLTSLPPWWINQFRGWSKYPNIEAYFVSGFFDCPQAVLRPEIITPTFERIKLGFELTSIWTMMPIFAHQYFNVMHITNQISSIFVLGIFPKKWRPTVTRATTWYKERFFESNKIN